MAPRSEEIREDIARTRERIDHDIEALQNKFRHNTDPRHVVESSSVPMLGGALALGLVLALIFVKRHEEEEPPLPRKGTRRRRVAQRLQEAEDEGLLSEDARRVLIGLLTTQGLQWLREYLEEESRKATGQLRHSAQEAGSTAATRVQEVEERAADALHKQGEAARTVAHQAGDRLHTFQEEAAAAVGAIASAVEGARTSAAESASHVVEQGKEGVQNLASQVATVPEKARQAAAQVGDQLDDTLDAAPDAAPDIETPVARARETISEQADTAAESGKSLFRRGKAKAEEAALRAQHETEQHSASAQAEAEVAAARTKKAGRSLWDRLRGRA